MVGMFGGVHIQNFMGVISNIFICVFMSIPTWLMVVGNQLLVVSWAV